MIRFQLIGDTMKIDCIHADTCSADYWSGNHLAHVQIPVYKGMSLKQIKESLRDEIGSGCVLGSDRLSYLLGDFIDPADKKEADIALKAVHAAINRIKPAIKGQKKFFTDLEDYELEDCDFSLYAFFVFKEI